MIEICVVCLLAYILDVFFGHNVKVVFGLGLVMDYGNIKLANLLIFYLLHEHDRSWLISQLFIIHFLSLHMHYKDKMKWL